ncbi:unnamed protein product (macronuclear) [Paramecium tetraurelia]|uniref:Uncharacterized protein n=1 Tax=Paramecium tetraurelia TaxID=5888 RepID=A0C558_PARTE|nr:uncharacterized protein GSPATT00006424001 [Paramecium tetraurelia]CAK65925.1 unnamed protein product [Paramecium tetraurelia]|eukprot:XP_001433322.1 hypothetical protein (macronuclear) [Paramecium tetraurelia strain d4-2]
MDCLLGSSYYVLIDYDKLFRKLKQQQTTKITSPHYQALNTIEQGQDDESQCQFNNFGKVSSDDSQLEIEEQFNAKLIGNKENTNNLVGEKENQTNQLFNNLKELEQNCNLSIQNLVQEQKNIQIQFSDLQTQFEQLKRFFEGKITEQIQIYSQTSSKLEQLDDLSQHFQTQISLVKQEQTKEIINLNEKMTDFTQAIQKNINEHADQIIALQETLSTQHQQLQQQQQQPSNIQENEKQQQQQQQQQVQQIDVSTPTNSANNGFSKAGLTRQNQEIGQLRKQSTYKKTTKP